MCVCHDMRFNVRFDAYTRRFKFSDWHSPASTRTAAIAYHSIVTQHLETFDEYKGKKDSSERIYLF